MLQCQCWLLLPSNDVRYNFIYYITELFFRCIMYLINSSQIWVFHRVTRSTELLVLRLPPVQLDLRLPFVLLDLRPLSILLDRQLPSFFQFANNNCIKTILRFLIMIRLTFGFPFACLSFGFLNARSTFWLPSSGRYSFLCARLTLRLPDPWLPLSIRVFQYSQDTFRRKRGRNTKKCY